MKIKIWTIILMSFIIKIIALIILPDLTFPDSDNYVRAGYELINFGKMEEHLTMPLHPIYSYFLRKQILIKLGDIILSCLTIYFIYKLNLKIFKNRKVAIISAIISAIYPYFIFYSIVTLSETFFIFLLVLSFYLLYSKRIFLASLIIIFSILHRPLLDFLAIPLIFYFSFIIHKLTLKKSIFNVFLYSIMYIILMTPWWIHQYNKYDSFVRLNLSDGIILYSGNNFMNNSGGGVENSVKGADVDLSIFQKITDPIEKNKILKKKAIQYIKNDKLKFAKMSVKKFVRFWRLWPYAPEYEKPSYIIISILSYGLCLLLFVFYLIKNLKKDIFFIAPILILMLFLTLVHMITISSIRYRLPLEPFIIILASKTLDDIRLYFLGYNKGVFS